MNHTNNASIRQALSQMLMANEFHDALSDDEWALLLERPDLLEPIRERAPDGLERAADAFRVMRRVYRPAIGKTRNDLAGRVSSNATMWSHADAITRIVAVRAERHVGPKRGLHAFRREVLNDRLLQLEDVEDWIQAKAREDATPVECSTKSSGGDAETVKLLAYGRAGSEWAYHVPTHHGGVLDRLRHISEYLARVYDWPPAQATLFVIVEKFTPEVEPIRVQDYTNATFPCLSRIVLMVGPTCTAEEVADYYRRAKSQIYGRLRRLSAKHAELAAFRAEQPDERTDREQLDVWNAEVAKTRKKWRYQQLKLFVRDADTARNRLIHPGSRGGRSHGQARTE